MDLALPPASPPNRECLTAKESAIRTAINNLKPVTTFAAIGKELSYSRQWVSKRMQERFRGDAAAMWQIGSDWRIPLITAEIFIRELYST